MLLRPRVLTQSERQGFQGRNNDASHSTVTASRSLRTVSLEKQVPCSLLELAGRFRRAHTRGCSVGTESEPGRWEKSWGRAASGSLT